MVGQTLPGVTKATFPRALVNAFVVTADVPTVVDTGTPGGASQLVAAIEAAGLRPEAVERILLTHRHADHAGNAAELARMTGAAVHAPPRDARYVSEGAEQPRPRPATPLGRLMVPYVERALPWQVEPVPVEESLTDGAAVGPFEVVETPGHTDGHVSLLWRDAGVLFCGDAAANITRVGPHPAADDPRRARQSFGRLAELEFDAAVFGHGRTIPSHARTWFTKSRGHDFGRPASRV